MGLFEELNKLDQADTSLKISKGIVNPQDPIFNLEEELNILDAGPKPSYPEVIGKGLLRGTEGLAGGVGSITRWAGDILGSDTISNAGKTASEYWNEAQTKGIAAPHPALYRGSFIDNPSLKRAVGIIGEAVPSLGVALGTAAVGTAAGLPAAAASGLAALGLGLLEGAPQYEESRETGKGVAESSLYGTLSTAGTALLEYLPISHILGRSGKPIISSLKGATEEGLQEGAQQIWQNLIAKLGYDDTRNLAEGLVESIIGGAGSGGIAGGTVAKLNSVAEKADIAGVSDDEIQAARQDLENQVENLANKVETQNLEPFQTFDPGAEERQQVIDTLGTRSGIPYEEPAPITWQKSFNDAISRAVTAKPGPERAEAVKDIIALKQEKQTLEEINQATIDTLGTRSGIPYEETAPPPPFTPVPPAAPRKMPGLGTLLKKETLEPDEIAHLQNRLGKAGSWNKRIENKLIEIGELNAERPGTQTEENRQSFGEKGQASQEEGTIIEGSEERLRIRQPGNAGLFTQEQIKRLGSFNSFFPVLYPNTVKSLNNSVSTTFKNIGDINSTKSITPKIKNSFDADIMSISRIVLPDVNRLITQNPEIADTIISGVPISVMNDLSLTKSSAKKILNNLNMEGSFTTERNNSSISTDQLRATLLILSSLEGTRTSQGTKGVVSPDITFIPKKGFVAKITNQFKLFHNDDISRNISKSQENIYVDSRNIKPSIMQFEENGLETESGEIIPDDLVRKINVLMEVPANIKGKGGEEAFLRTRAAYIKNVYGVDVDTGLEKVPQGKRTPAIQREGITPKTRTDSHQQIDDRISRKYSDILKIEIEPDEIKGDVFNEIDDRTLTPETLDKFLKESDNKDQDIIKVKSVIADQLGDLAETHKYEGYEEGKQIEDYLDSLLTTVRSVESGVSLPPAKGPRLVQSRNKTGSAETQPVSTDTGTNASKVVATPGMVRLDKGGVKPFTSFREITRGKNKGKIEVTLSNGKKQKVNPDQIREYPTEKTETPSLKDVKVKVKAVTEEDGREFELEQTAEEALNEIKAKRDILNELMECVS